MSRRATREEIDLALRLVGSKFSEVEELKYQLDNSTVRELADGMIREFNVLVDSPLRTSQSVLGEGSLYDIDGIPIIFTLLQRDGYVWRLDISRADSGRIRRSLDVADIVALGFGKGLSLERKQSDE